MLYYLWCDLWKPTVLAKILQEFQGQYWYVQMVSVTFPKQIRFGTLELSQGSVKTVKYVDTT